MSEHYDVDIDELRRVALSDDPEIIFGLVMSDHPVYINLAMSVQAYKASLQLPAVLNTLVSSASEHVESRGCIETAMKAAKTAFDSAIIAAWQYHNMIVNCDCVWCRLNRQREAADNQ